MNYGGQAEIADATAAIARRHLWYACELFAGRDRRFGGALPNPVAPTT